MGWKRNAEIQPQILIFALEQNILRTVGHLFLGHREGGENPPHLMKHDSSDFLLQKARHLQGGITVWTRTQGKDKTIT